jgi:hypothetical protein
VSFVEIRLSSGVLAGALVVSIAAACSKNGGPGQGSTEASGGTSTSRTRMQTSA